MHPDCNIGRQRHQEETEIVRTSVSIAKNQAVNDTDQAGKSWKQDLQYRIK